MNRQNGVFKWYVDCIVNVNPATGKGKQYALAI